MIVGGILLFILIETVRAKNTGFETKTLWDWMELLIIPLFLAGGAFYLQRSERAVERKAADDRAKLERELATDRQQEAALQAYLDRMADLLLKEKLGESESEKALNVARVRTLTVMRGLNATRNGIVLRFLHDIQLAGNMKSYLFVDANLDRVNLEGVDLSETNLHTAKLEGANLQGAHLEAVNLRSANLKDANLQGAFLQGANLQGANLIRANLQGAYLRGAKMQGAFLDGANLNDANLKDANLQGVMLDKGNSLTTVRSLKGATMPDGTKHD